MNKDSVTILGARGSVPISDPACVRYGGATTSVLVRLNGEPIVLDAGTGILHLPSDLLSHPTLSLLLTHPHLDHINGLSMCPYVMRSEHELTIYSAFYGGARAEDVLNKLYSPPVWPVLPEKFAAHLTYVQMQDAFSIGAIEVRTLEGVHPGGVRLIRLSCAGKSVVFATDCTLTKDYYPKAVAFAQDCDLLLCDGQYSDEEWEMRSGFGHNTWKAAAGFGRDCGAHAVRIVHHDPSHTDAVLDAALPELRAIHTNSSFARELEEIDL